jgi:hypothetical protein
MNVQSIGSEVLAMADEIDDHDGRIMYFLTTDCLSTNSKHCCVFSQHFASKMKDARGTNTIFRSPCGTSNFNKACAWMLQTWEGLFWSHKTNT